jgi:hypothetical protein
MCLAKRQHDSTMASGQKLQLGIGPDRNTTQLGCRQNAKGHERTCNVLTPLRASSAAESSLASIVCDSVWIARPARGFQTTFKQTGRCDYSHTLRQIAGADDNARRWQSKGILTIAVCKVLITDNIVHSSIHRRLVACQCIINCPAGRERQLNYVGHCAFDQRILHVLCYNVQLAFGASTCRRGHVTALVFACDSFSPSPCA